jgi:hypothetical protein
MGDGRWSESRRAAPLPGGHALGTNERRGSRSLLGDAAIPEPRPPTCMHVQVWNDSLFLVRSSLCLRELHYNLFSLAGVDVGRCGRKEEIHGIRYLLWNCIQGRLFVLCTVLLSIGCACLSQEAGIHLIALPGRMNWVRRYRGSSYVREKLSVYSCINVFMYSVRTRSPVLILPS